MLTFFLRLRRPWPWPCGVERGSGLGLGHGLRRLGAGGGVCLGTPRWPPRPLPSSRPSPHTWKDKAPSSANWPDPSCFWVWLTVTSSCVCRTSVTTHTSLLQLRSCPRTLCSGCRRRLWQVVDLEAVVGGRGSCPPPLWATLLGGCCGPGAQDLRGGPGPGFPSFPPGELPTVILGGGPWWGRHRPRSAPWTPADPGDTQPSAAAHLAAPSPTCCPSLD